jgi:hypothetical protein
MNENGKDKMKKTFTDASDPALIALASRLADMRCAKKPLGGAYPFQAGNNGGAVQYLRALREVQEKRLTNS